VYLVFFESIVAEHCWQRGLMQCHISSSDCQSRAAVLTAAHGSSTTADTLQL
jgi:hypothetical protein